MTRFFCLPFWRDGGFVRLLNTNSPGKKHGRLFGEPLDHWIIKQFMIISHSLTLFHWKRRRPSISFFTPFQVTQAGFFPAWYHISPLNEKNTKSAGEQEIMGGITCACVKEKNKSRDFTRKNEQLVAYCRWTMVFCSPRIVEITCCVKYTFPAPFLLLKFQLTVRRGWQRKKISTSLEGDLQDDHGRTGCCWKWSAGIFLKTRERLWDYQLLKLDYDHFHS